MILELRSYDIAVGRLADYEVAARDVGRRIRGDLHGRLEGHWHPLTGAPDRVVHLWSFDDFGHRSEARAGLAQNRAWAEEFLPLLPALVRKQQNKILSAVVPLASGAREARSQVYEMTTERAVFGAVRSWLDALAVAAEGRRSFGTQVGVFETELGVLNEVVEFWSYPSVTKMFEARDVFARTAAGKALEGSARELLVERHVELLAPFSFSPLG